MLLPRKCPGHWETKEGHTMAEGYAVMRRGQLTNGFMSDYHLANAQFLVDRTDPKLIIFQTAAKERIRWLSAQLALAKKKLKDAGID